MRADLFSGEVRPEPGQIWLIEQIAGEAVAPLDRAALTSANVVLYDRRLAAVVADLLPIHGYAEKLPPEPDAAGAAISRRAIEFAADGWSVVQFVEPRRDRRARLDAASAGVADLPIRAIAKGEPDVLTWVLGPMTLRGSADAASFTANGLAG